MSQVWRRGPGLGSCSPLRRLITWGEGRQDRQVSKWRCHHMVCLYCPLSFPQQTWILHCVPSDGALTGPVHKPAFWVGASPQTHLSQPISVPGTTGVPQESVLGCSEPPLSSLVKPLQRNRNRWLVPSLGIRRHVAQTGEIPQPLKA